MDRYRNLSLRDAKRIATDMGATVDIKPGTGEVRFAHILNPKVILTSQSRHDASQVLKCWLRDIESSIRYLRAAFDEIPGEQEVAAS